MFEDYKPCEPFANPNAADYIPTYIHTGFSDPSGRPDVKIRDDFYGTPRKMRIGVLGAGITCLNFLHLAEKLRNVEIVVYERNEEVGGVWLTSKYPGCRCDIPSIVYQFSWRRNIWSEMYAPAAENLEYLKTVARENDFYKFIKLRHEILQASWTDEEGKWTLSVKDMASGKEFQDKVDMFLEFNGPVSNPRLTPISGIENFKGEVVHPAYWTESTSVANKRVALIGYGCSGVQIAPNIIDQVSKLYTWYRNKTYILPPPNQAFSAAEGANFKYSDEQKELLKDPDVYLSYRKAVDAGFYSRYSYIINGSAMATLVRQNVEAYMRTKLAPLPALLESIMPSDFGIGCRRQTFAYGYLEAITSPKAHVFPTAPVKFTKTGLLDQEGVEHPIDMVIAATGYDQSHLPRFPKLVNGTPITDLWAQSSSFTGDASASPPSYMALALKNMPNYFNPSSAYGPLPQGNYYQSSEAFAGYIVSAIQKMQTERIVSMTPKDTAVEHFVRHANAWLKRTAMTGPCSAWYKGNGGTDRPPALWPGARSQFLMVLAKPRWEDWEMVYEDPEDMFGFMGNGWTEEVDGKEGTDVTWYMGQPAKEVGKEVLERLRGTDESVQRAEKKVAIVVDVAEAA